ncbi:MAG: acyl carrier protein, partial [Actinomadura rubrobrunea]|nr:acyl carrier protein [Actinomadura rubrobrunea]
MADNTTATVLDRDDLRETIAEIIDMDVEEVTDHARFVEDLGLDSLMALEITVRLEKKYGVSLEEEELAELTDLH